MTTEWKRFAIRVINTTIGSENRRTIKYKYEKSRWKRPFKQANSFNGNEETILFVSIIEKMKMDGM